MRKITVFVVILAIAITSGVSKGIPVVDIAVIEKIYSITSDVKDWFKTRRDLLNQIKGISSQYLDKFLSIYEKVKYFEYKEIGLDDIKDILETSPHFWDCYGKNTWWKIWNGEKSVKELYPELNEEEDLRNTELYQKNEVIRGYIDYLIPVLSEQKKEQENKIELIKKLKELTVDSSEKIEAFDRMINTASSLTGGKEKTGNQVKTIRILFNTVQIKIEQLGMRYRELILAREELKDFVKGAVRGYMETKKYNELVKNGEKNGNSGNSR